MHGPSRCPSVNPGRRDSLELKDLEEIIERASRRVPKIENAEVMRGVTGVYDMTPDARPLLGQVPGVEGLYICAGFSGMGFALSLCTLRARSSLQTAN